MKTNLESSSNSTAEATQNGTAQSSQLMRLFEDELKDIYWAENALTKAIPKMIKNATSKELIEALTNHLTETEEHLERLVKVFKSIDLKVEAIKCEAMAGILKEGEEIMEQCESGAMRDAGIISAAQKVEHYEIATYGTLRQFAETLGLKEAVGFLQKTLDEEKAADSKLSEVATNSVNAEASQMEA